MRNCDGTMWCFSVVLQSPANATLFWCSVGFVHVWFVLALRKHLRACCLVLVLMVNVFNRCFSVIVLGNIFVLLRFVLMVVPVVLFGSHSSCLQTGF